MIKALDAQGRVRRSRWLLVVAFVGSIAGVVIAFVSLRLDSTLISLPLAFTGAALSVISLTASRRWWGEADEAVKEAHKTGFYWGATGGLSVAGGLTAALFAIEPDMSLRHLALFPGDAGLLATGLALAIGLAFLGYLVGWAVWWLRNR
jgi:hypothetical protein